MIRSLYDLLTLVGGARRWLLLGGLATLSAGLEALAATAVFILLRLILSPGEPIDVPIVGDISSALPDVQDGTGILWLTTGMAVFFLFHAVAIIGVGYVQQRMAHNAAADLSVRLVGGYLTRPYEFHLQRSSADLIRNAHDAVQRLGGQVILPAIRLVAESAVLLGILVILVLAAPLATALVVGVLAPIILVLTQVVNPRLKRLGSRAHGKAGELLGILQQTLHGIREVIVYDRAQWFVGQYGRARRSLARSQYLLGAAGELPRIVLQTAFLVFILGFFAFSVMVGSSTSETVAILGLLAYAGLRMQPSLQKIVVSISSIKYYAAPVAEIYADLIAAPERVDSKGAVASFEFKSAITLRSVTARYPDTLAPAISNISVDIAKGSSIGICGPTGAGKSTLADVIAGLLKPEEGKVLVDGREIHEVLDSWQAQIGLVSQSVYLIDDSLRRNIAFGLGNDEIDETKVLEALELSQLSGFVDSLPEGLDTRVGERGIRLSGGQRQRVSIARAFYRDPSIVIFDEGTSALDNITERNLIDNVMQYRGDRTLLLIAHRMSTVQLCDYILFLDRGSVAGYGTYGELLEANSDFRDIAMSDRQ